MIRTRNFLLYVLALVFLVSSIGYMVSRDIAAAYRSNASQVAFVASEPVAVDVVATNTVADREAYIAQMKEKLARGEGIIEGAPVVLTSVDTVPPPVHSAPVTDRSVLWCGAPESLDSVVSSWQASEIDIRTAEGARIVTSGSFDTSADSGEMAIPDVLMQLPMRYSRAAYDSCLTHDIVGIALDGSLIENDDAGRYQGTGATSLIGYALDGFPIYGPTSPETPLDACGGADTGSGYEYHIRSDEDFVLGCFAASPASFIQ